MRKNIFLVICGLMVGMVIGSYVAKSVYEPMLVGAQQDAWAAEDTAWKLSQRLDNQTELLRRSDRKILALQQMLGAHLVEVRGDVEGIKALHGIESALHKVSLMETNISWDGTNQLRMWAEGRHEGPVFGPGGGLVR